LVRVRDVSGRVLLNLRHTRGENSGRFCRNCKKIEETVFSRGELPIALWPTLGLRVPALFCAAEFVCPSIDHESKSQLVALSRRTSAEFWSFTAFRILPDRICGFPNLRSGAGSPEKFSTQSDWRPPASWPGWGIHLPHISERDSQPIPGPRFLVLAFHWSGNVAGQPANMVHP